MNQTLFSSVILFRISQVGMNKQEHSSKNNTPNNLKTQQPTIWEDGFETRNKQNAQTRKNGIWIMIIVRNQSFAFERATGQLMPSRQRLTCDRPALHWPGSAVAAAAARWLRPRRPTTPVHSWPPQMARATRP
jgi:hypothetical protein